MVSGIELGWIAIIVSEASCATDAVVIGAMVAVCIPLEASVSLATIVESWFGSHFGMVKTFMIQRNLIATINYPKLLIMFIRNITNH